MNLFTRNGNAAMASPSPSSSTSSQHRTRDGSRSPVHRNSPSGAASNRSSLDLNRSCPSAGAAAKAAQAAANEGGGNRPPSALDMSRPASAWSLDGSAAGSTGGTPGKSSSSLQQNNQDRYGNMTCVEMSKMHV